MPARGKAHPNHDLEISNMRQLITITLILTILFCTQGCAPNGDVALNTVSDPEYESVKKLRSGQYTLISNQELDQLKQEAELGKSVGRYQIHRAGVRTWRLDTATGAICLLLAPEQDWKKAETAAEACSQ